MRNNRYNSSRGFTLIELSIVILIIGLIASSALMATLSYISSTYIKDTNIRLAAIEDAIDRFVSVNGFLPCPADPTDAAGTDDFGKSADCSVAPTGDDNTIQSMSLRFGMVPVKNLGLPEQMAYDGWQTRFTYAVTENLAQTENLYNSSLNGIRVNDNDGNALTSPNATGVAYVVFSHGKDKLGGHAGKSGAEITSCTGASLITDNCKTDDNVFIDGEYNLGSSTANYFDDIVLWQTKENLPVTPTAGQKRYIGFQIYKNSQLQSNSNPNSINIIPIQIRDYTVNYDTGYAGTSFISGISPLRTINIPSGITKATFRINAAVNIIPTDSYCLIKKTDDSQLHFLGSTYKTTSPAINVHHFSGEIILDFDGSTEVGFYCANSKEITLSMQAISCDAGCDYID